MSHILIRNKKIREIDFTKKNISHIILHFFVLYFFFRQTEDQIQTALEIQSVHSSVDEHYEEMMQYAEHHQQQQLLSQEVVHQQNNNYTPPALPPKTKIMFSPSRHLFSPSESVDDSDTTSVNTVEYVPVKEKVKLIAQQQEEIVRREEMRKKTGSDMSMAGGVRILPPSPVTVRKDHQTVSIYSHFSEIVGLCLIPYI